MSRFIAQSKANEVIADQWVSRRLRPTGVLWAKSAETGLFILVESIKEGRKGIFWPIQGGITQGEPLSVGIAREASEEVNLEVCPDRIILLDGMEYPNGSSRDGFTEGKVFFGGYTEYGDMNSGCNDIRPNPEEIRSIRYASREEILQDVLPANVLIRPETAPKAEFAIHILGQIAAL